MRGTGSARVAANIGAMIIGIVVAIAVAIGIGHLWPVMKLPVFSVALLCWILWGVTVMLHDRGTEEVEALPWSQGREYATSSRTTIVLTNLATILFGFLPASLAAGLIGLLWPEARWIVLIVTVALWTVGASVVGVLRDVLGIDIADKIW